MLTVEQISVNFPLPLRQRNPRGILVEYLQYELLDSLFKNAAAAKLSFIGGTAIRILHDSPRFSEDLDFDNFGLSFSQFEELLQTACRDMEYKGFLIEYRVVEKGAWHCYIRFPKILQEAGLSLDGERKILIRIDSEAKEKLYDPKKFFLNKFSVYRQILAALRATGATQVVLAGMESHICVHQSARGLLAEGFQVHVALDATCSRDALHVDLARGLWRDDGAVVSAVETVLFDWLGRAGGDAFRAISRLVR